jgi:hypothetical protein
VGPADLSPTWAALFGEPAGRTAWQRNLVAQAFLADAAVGQVGRARYPDGGAGFRASLVADLRRTQAGTRTTRRCGR